MAIPCCADAAARSRHFFTDALRGERRAIAGKRVWLSWRPGADSRIRTKTGQSVQPTGSASAGFPQARLRKRPINQERKSDTTGSTRSSACIFR